MDDVRRRLLDRLADNARRTAGLQRDYADIVAASESSNADDEHDPEGATIAYERQQVGALIDQARTMRAELKAALSRLEQRTYGQCQSCGDPIAAERLAARPTARTCVECITPP